jgi:ribosome assembly protein 4
MKKLEGHAHWVNSLSLSTDYALRSGSFDPLQTSACKTPEEAQRVALELWEKAKGEGSERLASGSDDHTVCLWNSTSKKPFNRMAGHQQPVNYVLFSPNGRLLASASFDKAVRLWDGFTGNFITAFRGHVGAVYQIGWSPDSRLLVSASRDSTMKVWEIATKKVKFELPGHADEIYSVDWSPDGVSVASGSKDRLVKIWSH